MSQLLFKLRTAIIATTELLLIEIAKKNLHLIISAEISLNL